MGSRSRGCHLGDRVRQPAPGRCACSGQPAEEQSFFIRNRETAVADVASRGNTLSGLGPQKAAFQGNPPWQGASVNTGLAPWDVLFRWAETNPSRLPISVGFI